MHSGGPPVVPPSNLDSPFTAPPTRLVRLVEAGDPKGAQWWEFLVPRQGKDGPLFVRKWLREALRQVRSWL